MPSAFIWPYALVVSETPPTLIYPSRGVASLFWSEHGAEAALVAALDEPKRARNRGCGHRERRAGASLATRAVAVQRSQERRRDLEADPPAQVPGLRLSRAPVSSRDGARSQTPGTTTARFVSTRIIGAIRFRIATVPAEPSRCSERGRVQDR